MTYTIDDVQVGDVVTFGKGTPGEVGYVLSTDAVAAYDGDSAQISLERLSHMAQAGWKIIDVVRPSRNSPPPPGSLALCDKPGDPDNSGIGLAISDGADWRDGKRLWLNLPNPIEALPVPASQLRDVIAEWGRAGYQRGVWGRSDNPMRSAVARFINATRAEWERAGIQRDVREGPFG